MVAMQCRKVVELLVQVGLSVAPYPVPYRYEDRELVTEVLCDYSPRVYEKFFHRYSFGLYI